MGKIFISGFINPSKTGSIAVNVYTCPVVKDNIVYGTLENPFKYIQSYSGFTSLSRLTFVLDSTAYVRFGTGSNTGTYSNSYNVVMIDEEDYDTVRSFGGWNDSEPVYRFEPVLMSGKWKLNEVLGSLTLNNANYRDLSGSIFGFPINVSINDKFYSGLRVTGLSGGSNSVAYTRLQFFDPTTNTYETPDLSGAILDFGLSPQPIFPDISTWLTDSGDQIYPYSYTVKSYNGEEILASLTEAPPMVEVVLTTVGNQKILNMIGSNERSYALTWGTVTPEGEKFLGLSNTPKSNRPSLTTDITLSVSWSGELIFYEAYGKYRPPATVFDINLYKNSAEVNRVDKGMFLESIGTLTGALRDECSLITPSIVYQSSDVPTFNYVYIPIFNRYYYVTSLSSVGKNVWRMELNCDVLMTYKDSIYTLHGVIGRQENDYNPLLVDTEIPTQNNPIVEVIDIPSDAFNTQTSDNGHNFLITVIGA